MPSGILIPTSPVSLKQIPSERLYESTKPYAILIFMSVKTSELTVCIDLMFNKMVVGGRAVRVSRISSTVEHVKYQ